MKTPRAARPAKFDFTCFTSFGRAFCRPARSIQLAYREIAVLLHKDEEVLGIVRCDAIATPDTGKPFTLFAYRGVGYPIEPAAKG